MIDYKESTIPPLHSIKYLDFFDSVHQSLSNIYKIVKSEQKIALMPDSEFNKILDDTYEAFHKADFINLQKFLLILTDQFSVSDQTVQNRISHFQELRLSYDLLTHIDTPTSYSEIISPLILQLFINILYVENENHEFSKYSIRLNRGIEIIMHLKRSLPENILPLVLIYAFNIYSECSHYIVNETTELYDYTNLIPNNTYCYCLAPLAMINILRNEEIAKDKLPNNFFTNLIYVANRPEPNISFFSMWCLYFYFKNSYMNAENAIQSKLLKLLCSKIECKENLIEAKIALYIFSFCYLVNDERKKIKCIKNTPIDNIMELMFFEEKEVSALSIALCNNYIISRPCNLDYFMRKDGFNMVCEIAQNGPLNCKIEAGIIITTILGMVTSENQENLFNKETLSILLDLWQINYFDLNMRIINLIFQTLPCYDWVIRFLIDENFEDELYALQGGEIDLTLMYSIRQLLRIIKYNKEANS